MLNKKIIGILKRELKDKLFSKSFIFMTLLIPGIFVISIGIQALIHSSEDTDKHQIVIFSEVAGLEVHLQKSINTELKNDFQYVVDVREIQGTQFNKEFNSLKPLLLNNSISALIFIPQKAISDKRVSYYSKNPKNSQIHNRFSGIINQAIISFYFEGKNLSEKDIQFAKENVQYDELKVSEDSIVESGIGAEILSFIFGFLLYIGILFSGQMVLRAVVEEKNNRIVEILLSSVSSNELIIGKILGSTITSLAQMLIWLLPLIFVLSSSWYLLPPELIVSVSAWQWLYYFVNFLIGLVTYLGLFAAVGSIFDNEQDAQSGMWPLMMLVMIPFFIAISVPNNPNNSIAVTTSMIPFTSIMVMPVRMGLVDVPLHQFLISLTVNFITLILIFPISGKIYRIGILQTGKKPNFKEVLSWIKMKNL